MKGFICFLLLLSSSVYTMNGEISAKEGFIPVDGGSLYYTEYGRGEPIVILHGGPGLDHSYFLPHFESLADKYRLIFFDQRACGKSTVDVDSTSISMNQFVEDLEMVRKYFKIEKMNLMGHSFGGLLTMRYAIKYPENLKSLMLINSTSATSAWRDSSYEIMSTRKDSLRSSRLASLKQREEFKNKNPEAMAEFFRLLFRISFYNPEKVSELNFDFQANYPESSKMLNYLFKDTSFLKYDLNDELKKLKMPVLIVGSENDIIPPMSIEELHYNLKNSTYVFIESCGHFPFIEEPVQFRKAIDKFFGRL